MAAPSVPPPSAKNISQIKSSLLQPALTSHYELYLPIPRGSAGDFNKFMKNNRINYSIDQPNIQLSCCEATLPGSNIATFEINNDYTGVTERHAHRRIYDDRIDLTFYVDTKYTVIKFFEFWMKYIVSESISDGQDGRRGLKSSEYFYTVRYPEEYRTDFSITKFEKDHQNGGGRLIYTFLNAYPISISSMPISYESSSLLKCTVSFSYTRYFIESMNGAPAPKSENSQSTLNNPLEQSEFNSAAYDNFINPEFGVDTTGGLSIQTALSSGNSIGIYEGEEIIGAVNANQTPVESGLPYVGRNVGPLAR